MGILLNSSNIELNPTEEPVFQFKDFDESTIDLERASVDELKEYIMKGLSEELQQKFKEISEFLKSADK